jgi:hypothetical protein
MPGRDQVLLQHCRQSGELYLLPCRDLLGAFDLDRLFPSKLVLADNGPAGLVFRDADVHSVEDSDDQSRRCGPDERFHKLESLLHCVVQEWGCLDRRILLRAVLGSLVEPPAHGVKPSLLDSEDERCGESNAGDLDGSEVEERPPERDLGVLLDSERASSDQACEHTQRGDRVRRQEGREEEDRREQRHAG